jgi:hypothetical protein
MAGRRKAPKNRKPKPNKGTKGKEKSRKQMKMTTMLKRRERGDDEEARDAGDVLRASGADADGIENKDGKDDDEAGEMLWWCATRLWRGR